MQRQAASGVHPLHAGNGATPLLAQSLNNGAAAGQSFSPMNGNVQHAGVAFGESASFMQASGYSNMAGGASASGSFQSTSKRKKDVFEVGEHVECLFENSGQWLPATIAAQHHEGIYEVNWQNGSSKDRVKSKNEIRHAQTGKASKLIPLEIDASQVGKAKKKDAKGKQHQMPPGEKYKNISVGSCINDVIQFKAHFARSNESDGLLQNVASPAEWDYIYEHTGIWHPVLANMLTWRRSVIHTLMPVMFFATCAKAKSSYDKLMTSYTEAAWTPMTLSFMEWEKLANASALPPGYETRTGSFQDYTFAVAFESKRLITGQAGMIQAWKACCLAFLCVFAWISVQFANRSWVNVSRSRKFILIAWFLIVAAPFIGSMVPIRQFVDWDAAAELTQIYTESVQQTYAADQGLANLKKSCKEVLENGEQRLMQSNKAIDGVCNVVKKFPYRKIKVPTTWKLWQKWLEVDMVPAHDNCAKAKEFMASGKMEVALKQSTDACRRMKPWLDEYEENNRQTPSMVKYLVNRATDVAETSVVFSLALQNMGQLMPAALSIAPGVVKGAARLKLLVPQSPIPGMFVLLLPWLYCPLTWCLYSLFSHLIGRATLVAGLLLIAYNPLIYVILGSKYELEKPMTDKQAVAATQAIGTAMKRFMILAVIFLLTFLVQVFMEFSDKHAQNKRAAQEAAAIGSKVNDEWGAHHESKFIDDAMEEAEQYYQNEPGSLAWAVFFNAFLFICSFLEKFFITGLAGFDWMIERLINLRRIERDMDETLQNEYNDRMDQMLSLASGKHYEDWVQQEWKAYEEKVAKKEAESFMMPSP